MKIKLTASLGGTEYALNAGDVTERFDDTEAQRLIEHGFAVPVAEAAATVAKRAAKARKLKPETR